MMQALDKDLRSALEKTVKALPGRQQPADVRRRGSWPASWPPACCRRCSSRRAPVFELAFAPEHQRELERLLAGLPPEVFKASDSLGWVYQFWQAKRKDEVNASEVKIGADELPAVTQLFTEPYMVDFLLHNSLGAWWVTRHPGKPCPVPLTYLRTPGRRHAAAGKFEGWPDRWPTSSCSTPAAARATSWWPPS
jgi:hypothetical protein